MFKGFANLGSLLQQVRDLSGKMQGVGEELRQRRAVGSAGGGLVEIEINGVMEVLRCQIDPQLVEQRDRELLEDLVVTAINQAVLKARQLNTEAVKSLEIPGLDQVLGKFLNTQEDEGPPSSAGPGQPS